MKTPEKTIKAILKGYKEHLGADYEPYLNHCERVYYYAVTLLLMRQNHKLAIAIAFHDLDAWVSSTMDYLPGSAKLAKDYIHKNELNFLPDELAFMISNHHKITPLKGNIEAEALRKADLIDLTGGWFRFNIPRSLIAETERKYPRKKFSRRIYGRLVSHAFKNPLRPFPMLKW